MRSIMLDAQDRFERYGIDRSSHGLSLYLDNLSKGRRMTPHSWLYEHRDDRKVLDEWIAIMQKANAKSPFGEEFSSFDLKQVEKFGPQGGIPRITDPECWEVVEPLYSSTEYDDPQALKEWFPEANKFGKLLFGKQVMRQRPLSPEAVVRDMDRRDTLTTNSGFPNFTKRFRNIEEEISYAKSPLAWTFPAIILFRYYYGKLRPVWMFPMSTNLVEAGFALPIQSCISRSPLTWVRDYCTPWLGFEHVKCVLTKQWPEQALIAGGDTTKMDAHMRPAQMNLVFEIVKWLFQPKYWDDLQRSLLHVTDIDLIYEPLGYKIADPSAPKEQRKRKPENQIISVIEGVHGLASGSSWTQLSETVLQLFMAYIAGTHGQGIGDDFYWLPGMQADALVSHLERFGLPANPAKQSVSDVDLTFLQRYYHQGFFSREDDKVMGAYYPTIRALGSMLWPEKFHDPDEWNSDMFCIRIFSIMENCVDDPCFDEFVRFVTAGHKDLIPFAKKTARDLNAIQRLARKLAGLFPNYNQEKLARPLSEYSSILLAKSL
nr:putative RNA-dependent RNA polymerase [Picobirnavirus sp.]